MTASLEGESIDARLNRYRLFDEVNAPYLRWQLEQFGPYLGQRVLEVGCGVGGVLAQLIPRDFVMGIDVEAEMVAYARTRFATAGNNEFATLDISALSDDDLARLERHGFDSVVCINVLEHVKDDEAALATMARVLVPGGALALLVPAHPSLYGRYDAMEGHFRRYTRAGLRGLLTRSGFAVTRLYSFNMVGAAGWWVQYRLLRQSIHQKGHFRLMHAAMPAMRAVESRVKPPFGLSLVAVARKPSPAP